MNESRLEDEHLDILQNLESAIYSIYLDIPALTDFDIDSALEALVKTYQGEATGKTPALPRNPLSIKVYDAVQAACEFRLGRSPIPKNLKKIGRGKLEPVPVEVILSCLKRIRKSIQLWTKQGGRQGYLYYISQFMV